MNRLIAAAVFFCAAIAACAGPSVKDAAIPVFLDGRRVRLDPPAIVRDGRAYVGLRGVASALGASVKWDEKTRTAVITSGKKRTKVPQSRGITIDDVFYLPLRTTAEAIGCTVEWDSVHRAVRITREERALWGGG